jgi:hypothetical protein
MDKGERTKEAQEQAIPPVWPAHDAEASADGLELCLADAQLLARLAHVHLAEQLQQQTAVYSSSD